MTIESDLSASDSWNSPLGWKIIIGIVVGAVIFGAAVLVSLNESPPVITHTYSCAAGDGRLVYDMSHRVVVSAFEQSSAGSTGIPDELVWESIDVIHRAHISYAPRYRPASTMLRELSYIGVCKQGGHE